MEAHIDPVGNTDFQPRTEVPDRVVTWEIRDRKNKMGIADICRDPVHRFSRYGDFDLCRVTNRPEDRPCQKLAICVAEGLDDDRSRIRADFGDRTLFTQNPGDHPQAIATRFSPASVRVPALHGDRVLMTANHQNAVCADTGSTTAECDSPPGKIPWYHSKLLVEDDKIVPCAMCFEKIDFFDRQADAPHAFVERFPQTGGYAVSSGGDMVASGSVPAWNDSLFRPADREVPS